MTFDVGIGKCRSVQSDSEDVWVDGPGGRVSSVLSLVKSKVTGKHYSGGDNDKVDLGSEA